MASTDESPRKRGPKFRSTTRKRKHGPTTAAGRKAAQTGQPSTVTKRPAELRYKYEPPKLQPIPRNVALGSIPDHEAQVLQAIGCGMLITEVAHAIGRDQATLTLWLYDDARSAKVRHMRRLSAIYWDEQAQKVVQEVPDNATPAQLFRARELANHYRWRARCIAPQDYGDKLQQLHTAAPPEQVLAEVGTDGARALFAAVAAAIGLQVTSAPMREGRILEHGQGDGAVTDGA